VTANWWWEPLGLDESVALMHGYPWPWWIGGGWAIDLHVGSETREHSDVDIVVRRADQPSLRDHFAGWDVQVAHSGALEPWTAPIDFPRNGLWARRDPSGPWELQFLLATTEGDEWVYRYDSSIRFPLRDIVLAGRDGIPYLRPELVLLNKSRKTRERDDADFASVLPLLDDEARKRLLVWLPQDHAWRDRL
jgi:Aminoglycoside-2''-adenylyltransferase